MAWFAVGAAVFSAVATIYASEQQAKAEEQQAQVLEKNAMMARSQASSAEDAQREHARKVIGQQLAATSESGGGLTGSNLDLLNDSLYESELDSMNIRYEGELKASGLNDQAAINRSHASSTRTGGYLSAAGRLVGASGSYLNSSGTVPYSYNGDASGLQYSYSSSDVRARR